MNLKNMYSTLETMSKPDNMIAYGHRVAQWNEVARIGRGGMSTDIKLQTNLIKEELSELIEALSSSDKAEVIDAACDLFVVSSYALRLVQWDTEKWESCMVPSDTVELQIGSLLDLVHKDKLKISDYAEILKQVVALCYKLDINLGYNMEEVLNSNDSKFPTITQLLVKYPDYKDKELEMLEFECKEIERRSKGRYNSVIHVQVGERVAFMDGNGKIMKPITFVEPIIKV